MSIVELLVAIGIGTLIVAAMAMLFANNSRSRNETERAGHNIENGRYALEVLRTDLHHAGYFAEFDSGKVNPPGDKDDPANPVLSGTSTEGVCATALDEIKKTIGLHIQGFDNVTAATVNCISDVKPGTDVFVTRRVSGCTVMFPAAAGCTSLGAGALAFQASTCDAELRTGLLDDAYRLETNTASLDRRRRKCTISPAPASDASTDGYAGVHRYLLRVYYVANNDKAGDGIPTLKYRELGAGAFETPLSLVQGVEQLQIEYGLDTNGDGDANEYTVTPATAADWRKVVSAKLFVLSRNLEPSPGHTDTKSYALGSMAIPAFNDRYKRRVFQEVVRLQNPSGRSGS